VRQVLSTSAFVRGAARLGLLAFVFSSTAAEAQDLVPGAYTPTPAGINVVTLIATINNGDIAFDPALPIDDGHGTLGATVLGFNRTLKVAGRSASVGAGVPYVRGHLEGVLLGQFQEASRSGLGDLAARLAVNLYGAPAMTRQQFAAYRAKTIVGLSVTVQAPIGQYDPGKVINIGSHRWAIEPELGVSRRKERWTFEGDLGASFFTDNTNFRNGGTRQQAPIVTTQAHLIYTIRPGLWVAGDGNFWSGGRVTTNGVEGSERLQNSRLGATFAVPIRRQQLRVSYSFGAFTTIGGDFQSLGVSYSYAWATRP
jgi:hypothetical protein